jgi:hypothetical protein
VVDFAGRLRELGIGEAHIARVVRLNPSPEEGALLRGLKITRTARKSFDRDVYSRPVFEARWGKGSASQLPPQCFIRVGGKRKFIAGEAYVQGPWLTSPSCPPST